MNRDNLLELATVLADIPEYRDHSQESWITLEQHGSPPEHASPETSTKVLRGFEIDGSCGTSACTAGHGALSDSPELEKREGEGWKTYIRRVYGLGPGEKAWDFAFSNRWRNDTIELARARIDYLLENGKAPPRDLWHLWEATEDDD